MSKNSFDVVVIGAGPAGSIAALSLLQQGYSVAVIEKSDLQNARIGEHLTPNAYPVLEKLGVLDLTLNPPNRKCLSMHSLWGSSEMVSTDYLYNALGGGVALSRPYFDQALNKQVANRGGRVNHKTRILKTQWFNNHWHLEFEQDKKRFQITTRYVVDATGRCAWWAKRRGATLVKEDRLIGISTHLPVDKKHSGNGPLVESSEHGWWYSTVLADSQLQITYFTDTDNLKKLGEQRLIGYFKANLAKTTATKDRLLSATIIKTVAGHRAETQYIDPVMTPHWVAVGDAANTFDPLSSAGLAKGILSADQAGQAVASLLAGKAGALFTYQSYINQLQLNHRAKKVDFYKMEKRWMQSDFWIRRNQNCFSN